MKIEKLSGNAVKITLTLQDMQQMNIEFKNLQPDDPQANEMFWRLIHLATKQTGVVFENCRLTVEVMQRDPQNVVVFITKSELEEENQKPHREKADDSVKRYRYKQPPKRSAHFPSTLVYSFEDFNDLCRFAKNNLYFCLLFDDNNSLYKHNDAYRLVVNVPQSLREYVKKFDSTISEYAKETQNPAFYASYLTEHEKAMIPSNSLKILYNNF